MSHVTDHVTSGTRDPTDSIPRHQHSSEFHYKQEEETFLISQQPVTTELKSKSIQLEFSLYFSDTSWL